MERICKRNKLQIVVTFRVPRRPYKLYWSKTNSEFSKHIRKHFFIWWQLKWFCNSWRVTVSVCFRKCIFWKYIFRKFIFWKCIFWKCLFRKCIFRKCIFPTCIFWILAMILAKLSFKKVCWNFVVKKFISKSAQFLVWSVYWIRNKCLLLSIVVL